MMKEKYNYIGKCGSCVHFNPIIKNNIILCSGHCITAPNGKFVYTNRHTNEKYIAKHSSYRVASSIKCSRYISSL